MITFDLTPFCSVDTLPRIIDYQISPRYIQFGTLLIRFFINDILCNIEIKETDVCNVFEEDTDHNEHMLLYCNTLVLFWIIVQTRITNLVMDDYILTNTRKIFGDL